LIRPMFSVVYGGSNSACWLFFNSSAIDSILAISFAARKIAEAPSCGYALWASRPLTVTCAKQDPLPARIG